MKNKSLAGLLISLILLSVSTNANADDVFNWLKKQTTTTSEKKDPESKPKFRGIIEPFGGITWEDSLKDVVDKISKIKDLENFDIKVSQSDSVSLKGIKPNELPKKVSEALLKKNDVYGNPKDGRLSPTYYMEDELLYLGKFRNKLGKDVMYYPNDIAIVASPVIISGVPFSLTIQLKPLPALSLDKPNKVFKDKIGYSYPLVVNIVSLYSDSLLLHGKNTEITDTLYKKYGIKVSNGPESIGMAYVESGFSGDNESYLAAEDGGTYYKIKYESTYYLNKYAEMYKNHLTKLEEQKNKGKKDLKNGL